MIWGETASNFASVSTWAAKACLAVFLGLCVQPVVAQTFDSRAPQAYLYDVNSRTVLYAKNETERFVPASIAKVLTAAVLFDQIDNGPLSTSTFFPISEDAWRRGGGPSGRAAMFAELNSLVAVEDLLRGLIIMAGNDAAIALAEGVAGNEEAFGQLMTERAVALGATDSAFTNATGEPEEGMFTTTRDMVRIADRMMIEHPTLSSVFGEPEFTWNDIFQRNRNPIFREIEGTIGFMAGFSDESGYGLLGAVEREGRRVVFALSGLDTTEGRVDEARRLVRYAYDAFRTVRVADPGEAIAFARTFGGSASEVGLVAAEGALELLLPREGEDRVRARVVYDSPLPTPIAEGQQVGRLLVERDGTIIQETPLVAAQDIETGSLARRAGDGLRELLFGWIPPISFAGTL
jgi:D-alanyl-D-alanine carboxypeptidase (penicillin-binding protein 5/6)